MVIIVVKEGQLGFEVEGVEPGLDEGFVMCGAWVGELRGAAVEGAAGGLLEVAIEDEIDEGSAFQLFVVVAGDGSVSEVAELVDHHHVLEVPSLGEVVGIEDGGLGEQHAVGLDGEVLLAEPLADEADGLCQSAEGAVPWLAAPAEVEGAEGVGFLVALLGAVAAGIDAEDHEVGGGGVENGSIAREVGLQRGGEGGEDAVVLRQEVEVFPDGGTGLEFEIVDQSIFHNHIILKGINKRVGRCVPQRAGHTSDGQVRACAHLPVGAVGCSLLRGQTYHT